MNVLDVLSFLSGTLNWVLSHLWWVVFFAIALALFKVYSIFRPVIDPILAEAGKLIQTPVGRGILAAVAALLVFGLGAWVGASYQEKIDRVAVLKRERDEAQRDLHATMRRLDQIETIRFNDAERAKADNQLAEENRRALAAIPRNDRLCFDESDSRRLFRKR